MAEKTPTIPYGPLPSDREVPYTPPATSIADLAAIQQLSIDLGHRNTLGDSAVNILDTLQSLGTLALSPLPGINLEDARSNSEFLDQFRSPAYLATRQLNAMDNDPEAGFFAAAAEAAADAITGGNLVADLAGQVPYLMMGPAARLASVARADKAAGVLGKVAQLTAGTGKAATANRLAALSGAVEAGGAYAETYHRALEQTGSVEEAERQARMAAAASAVLGTVLGRITPAFELDPTGRLGGNLASNLSAIASEAIVEEGGLAVGQTMVDNILAGEDMMKDAGSAFGEAAAISGVFTGGMRAPSTVLDMSRAIGKGISKAIGAAADRANTPEKAAANAAEEANKQAAAANRQTTSVEKEQEPVTEPAPVIDEAAIRATLENQGLEGDALEEAVRQAILASEPDIEVPPEVQAILEEEAKDREIRNSPENRAALEAYEQEEAEARRAKEDVEDEVRASFTVDTNSSSDAVRTILVDAATDALIENTTGEEQAAAVARKEELAPTVKQAQEVIEKLPEARVAEYVEAAANGNAEAIRRVEAVKRTDISKLPEKAVPENLKEVVKTIKEFKDLKIDQTTNEILEEGFSGHIDSRGVRGYLQDMINFAALGVKRPNEASRNLERFVAHLEKRAQAFRDALDSEGEHVAVEGTRTRAANGRLTNKPFVIHKNNANSMAVVNRVFEDVARAREALEKAKEAFPKMFEEKSEKQSKKQEKPAPVAPVATTAPATTAAPVDEAPVVEKEVAPEPGPTEEASAETPTTESATNPAVDEREQTPATDAQNIEDTPAPVQQELDISEPTESTAEVETEEAPTAELEPSPETSTEETSTEVTSDTIPFALFNGVNRFVQAFTPTGGGMLKEGYEALIAKLRDGSEDEQRAADTLEKFVPRFRVAINDYMKRVLEQPVSKKDSTKLKDALSKANALADYPNYVWTQLLVQTEDGYALHPAVVDAASVAGTMQLVRAAFQRHVDADEVSEATDDLYYQWVNNIGKDAMRILGVTPKDTESLTLTDGIPKALGSTILEVLRDGENITVTTVKTEGNKTLKSVTMDSGVRAALREHPAFPEVMRKHLGDAEMDTIVYGEAPEDVKPVYRNSRIRLSRSQRRAVRNRQKVKHHRNTGFLNVINALGADLYTQLVTGFAEVSKDKALEEISKSLIVGVRGELNAVAQYNAGIELHAKEAGVAPEEVDVFFKYEILRNGRSFSGFSPQTKKTLREFLTVGKQTLDLTKPEHVRGLKLAIAQAMGIKTDINTHEAIIAKLDEMIPELREKASALYRASIGESVPELPQLMDRDNVYEPKEIHGLLILGKYLANPTDTAFENTLTYEIDGKTNGPFMAELLFGLHTINEKTYQNLEQGGFFSGVVDATLATMQNYLRQKYGSADLYERVAAGAPALQDEILYLAGFVSSTGAISRAAAKEAVTPLVYGSGVGSLSRVFAHRINAGLADRLRIALKHGDTALANKIRRILNTREIEDLGKELADSLQASYADQKPQVTYVNNLMVAATTLHAAVRQRIFEERVAALLKQKRESGELPKQYELSRADYNKILRELPGTEIEVPGMGIVSVGESHNTGRSATTVEGAGKVHSISVSKPEIEMPGVSILALSTIGAGDATMGNALFQEEEQVLDVYDGIEIPVTEIDRIGVKLNEVIWNNTADNLLDNYGPMLDWVIENAQYLGDENTSRTLKELRSRFGVRSNKAAVVALKEELEILSAKNKAGRAFLNSKASSFNQMSGGGIPFNTTPTNTVRDAVSRPPYRKGWDNTVEAGFDANNGSLNREGIIAVLDNVKWPTRVQKFVWSRLRNLLPESLIVQLAKNEAEWDQFGTGRPYGSVAGSTFINHGRVVMATTSAPIILHELIHVVLSQTIDNYFANINSVPPAIRQAINDLVQLLNRFKKLEGGPATKWAQSTIAWYEQQGDMAAAVDEMLTYVISEEAIINELAPGLFTRIITRAKQILFGLIGKEVPGTFLDDVLKSFNSLVKAPRMEANDSFGIRDHVATDPLLDRTKAALRAISKKIARGQHFKVPKIKDSSIDVIRSRFNLNVTEQRIYERVWLLLRMENRPPELERFATNVLNHHPEADIFNGTQDAIASVMALAAANPTFRAQVDALWKQHAKKPNAAMGLVEAALNRAPITDSQTLLMNAMDGMAADAEYHLSYLATAASRLDRMGNEWMERIGNKALDLATEAPQGVSHVLAGIHALTTESGAEAFGKTLIRSANEFTEQRWLQDLIAALVGSQPDTNLVYRQVNQMKSTLASLRALFTTTLPAYLKKMFPPDFDGWDRLYRDFGRLDVGVLGTSAAEMFRDDAARKKAINALKSKLPNHEDATNLAHYMVHGTSVKTSRRPLLRNARAIADNLNGTKRKATDDLVADVDQLVTLMAIDMLDASDRARISDYFTKYPDAMNNLIGMLQKVNEEELKQYDHAHRYVYWKGALPLSTDPRMSVVVAGPVKGASLEALGYTKGKKYEAGSGDPGRDLYYYTRKYAPPPVFTQGVLATVQQTAMGINYTTAATISPEVGTMIADPRLVRYISQNMTQNIKMSPVFNVDGDIVGYERLLDREYVQKHTGSNNTLLHIAIGKRLGRILEERLALRFNKEGIKILVKQWEEGKARGEEAQYVDVSNSTDKQIVRAWEVIPADTKKALIEAFGGPVMIRKDLIANTLGYYKAGINDIFTGEASLSEKTRKALYGVAQTVVAPFGGIKHLYAAELAIKEAVATAKDWIIVRSISVALNNAMASASMVLANGVPLKELINSYREGIAELRAYGQLQKEVVELTVKIAGATGAERARLQTIQKAKREAIKKLAIYPLIEAGELSDLPEGLADMPSHSYMGDFAEWANNYLRKIHPKTPMVVANLLIAKDTVFHDRLSKAIQAGDFLGKWAVYKHMIRSGKTPEVARDVVRDEFVDYGTNPGRFRGALEDFGLVYWSQFTLRMQRVLLRRFRRNPFSFFMSNLAGDMAGIDTPMDGALFNRGLDNSIGLDGVLSAPSAHIWAKVF